MRQFDTVQSGRVARVANAGRHVRCDPEWAINLCRLFRAQRRTTPDAKTRPWPVLGSTVWTDHLSCSFLFVGALPAGRNFALAQFLVLQIEQIVALSVSFQ